MNEQGVHMKKNSAKYLLQWKIIFNSINITLALMIPMLASAFYYSTFMQKYF
jgi:hypothetical protein